MGNKTLLLTYCYEAPCGNLLIGELQGEICMCVWQSGKGSERIKNHILRSYEASELRIKQPTLVLLRAIHCLDNYFQTGVISEVIPYFLCGTDFQLKVWKTLLTVPSGKTVSYLDLARNIGRPSAVRAVANAVASNPISIIFPCHRVIGTDGSLTGYAGGLPAKRFLLSLESESKSLFV